MRKLFYIALPLVLLLGCGKDAETPTPEPSLEVSVSSIALTASGASKPALVSSDMNWTSEIVPSGSSAWLSVTPSSGAAGNTTIQVKALANDTEAKRTATVKINAGSKSYSFSVSQENLQLTLVPASDLPFDMDAQTKDISVTTNSATWSYICTDGGDWCTAVKNGDNAIRVTVKMNPPGGNARMANLRVTAGTITRQMTISQAAFTSLDGYYADKQTLTLQTHTVGAGVKLVIMGDGYTLPSMRKNTGQYETEMRAAADHFFSTYPLSAFRNYFDVYMVAAISNQSGMDNLLTGKKVDTALSTVWEGGTSTGINCSTTAVMSYVRAIAEFQSVTDDQMPGKPITVLMPINENVYAGTCLFYWSVQYGMSISMCPVGSTFKNVVVHECTGHGFAKLVDEYIYYPSSIPETSSGGSYSKSQIRNGKVYGSYENVDLNSNMAQTTWSGFAANRTKYPDNVVSIFEGSCMYKSEIYRPEKNSCMNNNVLYFNAPSRYAQVRRVQYLSGNTSYSLSDFMAWDTPPDYSTVATVRSPEQTFIPLGRPIQLEYHPE